MNRLLFVGVVLILLAATAPVPVGACVCRPADPSPCVAASEVDAVFVGEVVEWSKVELPPDASPFMGEARNRMRVSESFRGDLGSEVDIYTNSSGSSCSSGLEKGVPYVVYARRGDDGRLRTGMCMRTHRVASDKGDLAYLRAAAQAPGSSQGLIVGRALVARVGIALGGVQVVAQSATQRYEMQADRDGYYTFTVPRGSYLVSYGVGDGLYSSPARVDIARDGMCVLPDAPVLPDGRLTGRVVDSAGVPVANISVFLALMQNGSVNSTNEFHAVTDRDGVFNMSRVVPGAFLLGIGVGSYQLGDTRRVFHPGVVEPTRATTFSLELGENRTLPDTVLPAEVELLTVAGIVRNASGTPVAGAKVTLIGTYQVSYTTVPRTRDAAQPVTTGSDGRFTITTLAGEYALTASRTESDRDGARVARMQVEPSTGQTEVVLTLPD